jgi:hypothetical protein
LHLYLQAQANLQPQGHQVNILQLQQQQAKLQQVSFILSSAVNLICGLLPFPYIDAKFQVMQAITQYSILYSHLFFAMQDVSRVPCLHAVLHVVILDFQSQTVMQSVLVQGMSWCGHEYVKSFSFVISVLTNSRIFKNLRYGL